MSTKFNPYINYNIVSKCLNISERKAQDIIRSINKQIQKSNKKTIRGNVPSSEFEKMYLVNRETVLHYWRQSDLNCGQEEKSRPE